MLTAVRRLRRTGAELAERAARLPVIRTLVAVQKRFREDDGSLLAAAMTYRAFLSLFPLVLLGLSVIGFIVDDPGQRARWVERMASAVPGLGAMLSETLQAVTRDRAAIGVIGLVGVLWTGTGIIRASGRALGIVYRVPDLHGVKMLWWALWSLAALGAMSLVSIALAAFARGLAAGSAGRAVTLTAMFAVDALLFLVAYRVLTQRRGPRFRNLWAGALLAAGGWAALKIAGVWYAARAVSNAESIYGAFAATIGILLTLSVAARLFLYGAELNAVLLDPERDVADDPLRTDLPPLPRRMAG